MPLWFRPADPIDARAKAWTEWRMAWLVESFGLDALRNAKVILPTDEFFPGAFSGTIADAEAMKVRVCEFMGIAPKTVELGFFSADQVRSASGLYERSRRGGRIYLLDSILHDPESLVATLAHELAHVLLLGGRRLTSDVPDHEFVTDLLPVFLGLGVFGANAVIRESMQSHGQSHWWSISRHGYLPARIYGYAFALFAWLRGESKPAYARHLRLDARKPFQSGLRFLERTNDSAFGPYASWVPPERAMLTSLLADLGGRSASRRMLALWELASRGEASAPAAIEVGKCLADRDPTIRAEAAWTLAAIGSLPEETRRPLLAAVRDPDAEVRACAALALANWGDEVETAIQELRELLGDRDAGVAASAAATLSRMRSYAQPAVGQLAKLLARGLVDCDGNVECAACRALIAIADDPESALLKHLPDVDPEIKNRARASIGRVRKMERPADSSSSTSLTALAGHRKVPL